MRVSVGGVSDPSRKRHLPEGAPKGLAKWPGRGASRDNSGDNASRRRPLSSYFWQVDGKDNRVEAARRVRFAS